MGRPRKRMQNPTHQEGQHASAFMHAADSHPNYPQQFEKAVGPIVISERPFFPVFGLVGALILSVEAPK